MFLSAFLLFQVQPLIGKFIVPWFGGTPSVWTTCLLFFQVLLCGGYAYAHGLNRRFQPRTQAIIHAGLLVAACALLPVVPNAAWKPTGAEEPVSRILALLAVTVGVPFFVLSATGPLLQAWFSRTFQGQVPYRLYALSNAGSLLALITFPAVFDWLLATRWLAYLWSASFAVFGLLCAVCAWSAGTSRWSSELEAGRSPRRKSNEPTPARGTYLLWFFLAMVPSVLLLATTNQLCLEMASVPFLWILPLTVYLLSFVICFDSERWYSRTLFLPAAAVALVAVYLLLRVGPAWSLSAQVTVYAASLFLCAMACHGELVRHKPSVEHLTSFYLLIAAGGAVGGIFVGVVAPLVFRGYYELHMGLFACAVLMLVVLYSDPKSRFFQGRPHTVWLLLLLATGAYGMFLLDDIQDWRGYDIANRSPGAPAGAPAGDQGKPILERNFYGVLKVLLTEENYKGTLEPAKVLDNGPTTHGFQFANPRLWAVPTAYYGPQSGIGRVLAESGKARRVGIIGLGIGTLATYARPGDDFRFYEINANVERLAREQFHYLDECRGHVDVVRGDGRLALERETAQNFDVLVLDAFAGDAIPVHLLTREAFSIYLRHLARNGILAVHISTRHFALEPVIEAVADVERLATVTIESPATEEGASYSVWVLVSRNPAALDSPHFRAGARPKETRRILWTDDHASLFQVWAQR